jgi:hypothetical protein
MAKSPTWQTKEGKNPKGGLNAKGRASYNKPLILVNPDLKPPAAKPKTEKDSVLEKNHFALRMSGMKKKLTSAKTANDPNSRINKSLTCMEMLNGDDAYGTSSSVR